MSDIADLIQTKPAEADEDSAKRRQIIEGARAVFLSRGFDAASMGDIAKAAGVSKGTLYVYFKDKDELFAAIVQGECSMQAERVFDFDHDRPRRRERVVAARQGLREHVHGPEPHVVAARRDRGGRAHAGHRPQGL